MTEESNVNPETPEAVEAASEVVSEEVTETTAPVAEAVAEVETAVVEAAVVEVAAEEVAVAAEEAAVVEAVAEVAAEAAPVVAEAAVVAPKMDLLADEAPITRSRIGYTGEIEGEVYKLSDLQNLKSANFEVEQAFEKMLEIHDATQVELTEGEIVKGRVVSIGEKDIVVDIGFKSDGVVSRNEFEEAVVIDEEIDVFLERLEDRQGQPVLSRRRAVELSRWNKMEEAFNKDEIVEGLIVRRIKGGMIVDLFGKEAFLPGSQIDVRPVRDFDSYLNRRMEFKIVKLNDMNGNVVVSHKALIEKDLENQRVKILEKMEPGQVLEGTVKNITDFGVFIDLGGVDGLLHITDLSWGRVNDPRDVVELDQKVQVVVLEYDKDRQRISLGMKQLQQHPWDSAIERFAEGTETEGKIVSITDYGAFVELDKGIEGLVHISEMSWKQHVKHPSQLVNMGDTVKVKVLSIDKKDRKISLGMKQLEPDPWGAIEARFPAGTVTKGVIRNLTNFGVFVEIEAGIDGLVHVSDLSWTKKIRHPGEIVKKGDEIDVVVLDIDQENRRLSLGHKQVETNPWNQFSKAYANGTDVVAKVVRFNENGAIVELPLEVEAFVPAGQLVKSGSNPEETYKVGVELKLRVIEFNQEDKRIVLSEKAIVNAEKQAEKAAVMAKVDKEKEEERKELDAYQGAGSTGAATLGELSGLANLKFDDEAAQEDAPSES
jgi:small subunit ribosomal protein S1